MDVSLSSQAEGTADSAVNVRSRHPKATFATTYIGEGWKLTNV